MGFLIHKNELETYRRKNMEMNLFPLNVFSFSVFGTRKTFDTTRACGAVCNKKGGGMKEAKPARLLDILS